MDVEYRLILEELLSDIIHSIDILRSCVCLDYETDKNYKQYSRKCLFELIELKSYVKK